MPLTWHRVSAAALLHNGLFPCQCKERCAAELFKRCGAGWGGKLGVYSLFPSRTLCWSCLLHSCPAVTCGPSLLSRTTVGDGRISSGLLWVAGSWRAAIKRTCSRWRTSWQPSTLGSPMLQSRAGTAIIKFTFAYKMRGSLERKLITLLSNLFIWKHFKNILFAE